MALTREQMDAFNEQLITPGPDPVNNPADRIQPSDHRTFNVLLMDYIEQFVSRSVAFAVDDDGAPVDGSDTYTNAPLLDGKTCLITCSAVTGFLKVGVHYVRLNEEGDPDSLGRTIKLIEPLKFFAPDIWTIANNIGM